MKATDKASLKVIGRMFWAVAILELVINYDCGAVPAVLEKISQEYDLLPVDQGLLGALQYVGLALALLFSGHIFQKFDTKYVLGFALLANLGMVLGFALSRSKSVLLLTRFGVGLTQALIVRATDYLYLFLIGHYIR